MFCLTRNFLRHNLPRLKLDEKSDIVLAVRCLYTSGAGDEDFIIGTHPDDEDVVVATGFQGEGFKFSPFVGEMVAQVRTLGLLRPFLILIRPSSRVSLIPLSFHFSFYFLSSLHRWLWVFPWRYRSPQNASDWIGPLSVWSASPPPILHRRKNKQSEGIARKGRLVFVHQMIFQKWFHLR